MKYVLPLHIIKFLLILLFMYTGLSKLANPESLLPAIKALPAGRPVAAALSRVLPVVEIIVALMLVMPGTTRAALYISLFLMAGFTAYLAAMVIFVPHLPCSCGGVLEYMTWKQHIAFNVFFIGLTITVIYLSRKHKNFVAIKRLEVQQAQ